MKNMLRNNSSYRNVTGQFTDEFIVSSGCVVLSSDETSVEVAVKESSFETGKEFLEGYFFGRPVNFVKVTDAEFVEFAGKFMGSGNESSEIRDDNDFRADDVSDAAAVNVINSIFLESMRVSSSDIHIEPYEDTVNVRYRIDGVMKIVRTLGRDLYVQVVNRLKVMADINVMESRLPQDGRIEIKIEGESYDVRFSSVPVRYGESVVLRLFSRSSEEVSLGSLGFSEKNLDKLERSLESVKGIILLTGPTGSGKTTTLHSMIQMLDRERLKVITIEDPVERKLEGVCQIQVNEEIGLTFDSVLRRVLRQDPDVIMVGEIRDAVTAELALRAALTGHLILSTLHTESSASVFDRLTNMGLDGYLVSSVLKTAGAQRLVRCVCPDCAEKVKASRELSAIYKRYFGEGLSCIYESRGCEKCKFTGFRGRTVVSEILTVDDSVREVLGRGGKVQLEKVDTIFADGLRKVSMGVTTVSELKREGVWKDE